MAPCSPSTAIPSEASTRAGTAITIAGSDPKAAGFSGDGGPATAARLNAPRDLTADRAGNVYVADSGNLRVRRIGTDGIITTLAGNGTPQYGGDGGPGRPDGSARYRP